MNSMLGRLWILGCAQNSARYLPHIFANLERCQSYFQDSTILVLENDSRDGTCAWLRQYGRSNGRLQAKAFKGLNERITAKTVRLAALRNAGIDWLRAQGALESANDLVMILDLDEVNADPWDFIQWEQVLSWFLARDQAGAVFANQQGPYYDLWALRHPQLCPHDVWWHVYQIHLQHPLLSDEQCIERGYAPWQFTLSPDQEPFQVESAFGGLGLYKTSWLRRAQAPIAVSKPACCLQLTQVCNFCDGRLLNMSVSMLACERLVLRFGFTQVGLIGIPRLLPIKVACDRIPRLGVIWRSNPTLRA